MLQCLSCSGQAGLNARATVAMAVVGGGSLIAIVW